MHLMLQAAVLAIWPVFPYLHF